MEKTDKKVTIPVLPELEPVLERWGGSAPPAISNQKFNRYIKEACKAAGIVGEETITKWSGGMRVTVSPQKYTLITSHTGRRSFATNEYMRCIRDGRDWSYLVDIMGHSSTKQFFQYIKVESEERAAAFAIDRAKPLNKKAG
jgi:integrase